MISRRILTTFLIALMAIFVFQTGTKSVHSAPANYDFAASTANAYTTDFINYYFENLTASTTYTWRVQELNTDGTVIRTLKTVVDDSATSTSFFILANEWPVSGFGPNNDRAYGLYRVIDQFDRVLGQHWVSQPCHADWANFSDLVGMANVCKNDDTIPTFFHDQTNPDASTTDPTYPNLTFLHYRTATSTTDKFHIYNTDTGVLQDAFELSSFIDYQENVYSCPVSGCLSTINQFIIFGLVSPETNFVVVSTNGIIPAGISEQSRNQSYTDPGHSDPNRAEFAYGVYDYAIFQSDDTTLVNGGQSVLVVSTRSSDESEWQLAIDATKVLPSGTQKAYLTTLTSAVGGAYDSQDVIDSVLGAVDSGTYSYQALRTVSYTVDSTEQTGVSVEWIVGAASISYSTVDPTLYDFVLTSEDYEITQTIEVPTTVLIEPLLPQWGLNTVFGHSIVMVFVWILGFWASSAVQRGNYFLQLLTFALLGALYIFVLDPPFLLKFMYAMGVVASFILIVRSPGRTQNA